MKHGLKRDGKQQERMIQRDPLDKNCPVSSPFWTKERGRLDSFVDGSGKMSKISKFLFFCLFDDLVTEQEDRFRRSEKENLRR